MICLMWLCLWWRDQPWCRHSRACSGGCIDARLASRLCHDDLERVWEIVQKEKLRRNVHVSDDAECELEAAVVNKEGYLLVEDQHV